MSEYKFNCPGCGQHILANESWVGRRIDCPSCNTSIIVPPPAKERKKNAPVLSAAQGARPKLPSGSAPQTDIPAKEAGALTPPTPALPAPRKAGQTSQRSPAKEPKKNVPVMPPAPSAPPRPPSGPPQTDMPTKEAGTVTAPAPVLPASGNEDQAAKTSPAKEPKKNAPVMPPTGGAHANLRGGLLETEVPAKEDRTVTAGTPAFLPPEKEDKVARTSPAKRPKKNGGAQMPPKSVGPKVPSGRLRVELPAKSPDAESALDPPPPSPNKEGEVETAAATAPETEPEAATDALQPPEQLRVAVLSPAVKQDMVRAVRRRIADEAAWLPGKVKGATAYAAKTQEGELALLDAKDSEATRFSLIGAFLREMHERQVVKTATGRRRFLDEEIPDAIREVLLEEMSDEERERAEETPAEQDVLAASHAQCLAVLDVLEARSSQRAEQRQIEGAKRRLGNVRLPELVKKLEKKVGISPEELATALYHEVMDLRRRLERMEARLDRKKPFRADEAP